MKTLKFITLAILAGITCVTIYSCGKSDVYKAPDNPVDTSSVYKVNVTATQFDPSGLTMLVGSKVTWTNMDTSMHSVVSDDGTSFNSGNLSAGSAFSFTPATTGMYNYHCGVHPAVKGVLYVVTR